MARNLIHLAAGLLVLGAPAWAEPPAAPAAAVSPAVKEVPAAVVVPVAAETLTLEARTLPMMPALVQGTLGQMHVISGRDSDAARNNRNNQSGDAMDPGGTNDAERNNYTESGDGMDQPNAMRLYGFTLEPGERLLLKLKSENSSKMWMRFGSPLSSDPMTAEVMAANRSPKTVRANRITVRNVTKAPYKLIAMLYGESGYHYHVDIVRTR